MRQVTDILDTFSGVGYGQVASLVLPTGPTYNAIGLDMTGVQADQVEFIQLFLNGSQIVNVTGDFFHMSEGFKGKPQADSTWIIQLLRDELRTNEGQRLGELVTLDNDKLVLKVKIGAARAGQDGVPTIDGWSETTAAQSRRRFVPKILEDRIEIGAAGLNNFRTFAKGGRILGMHLMTPNVSQFEVWINKLLRHRNIPNRNQRLLSRQGFIPQNGVYHFVPVASRFGALDAMRTAVNSLEFKLTMSQPGDIDVVYELIESESDPLQDPFDAALAEARV